MDFLHTLVSFIVAISILIAFHEFGHFYVARRLGVKVLRYSIGFGRPLFTRRGKRDNTEYVVAAIPLGGYVKMLDEREGEVAETEVHRAFNRQKLWVRSAIVFAGPAFNFIFAILAYILFFSIGVVSYKPLVGDVTPGSAAAQAGIHSNMQIIAVNGEKTPIWDLVMQKMLDSVINDQQVELQLEDQQGQKLTAVLPELKTDGEIKAKEIFQQMGFFPWRPPVIAGVGGLKQGYPAEEAGLKLNDRIIAVDGIKVNSFEQMADYVNARPGQSLDFTIQRDSQLLQVKISPKAVEENGKQIGLIGVHPMPGKYPDSMEVEYRFALSDSLAMSFQRTWDNSIMMLKMLGKIVTGELSVRNLSGPINIALYAGYSASAGISRFVEFLALVSISLAVLNLLPIPLLDGGHLMFYLVEMVKGRPVTEEVEAIGQRIGIAILFFLISLAFYNDIARLLG